MNRKLLIGYLALVSLVLVFGSKVARKLDQLMSQSVVVLGDQDVDPAFLGVGWVAEQNAQGQRFSEVDLSKVELISPIEEGEDVIPGEEWMQRLKESNRLDARLLKILWEKQELIPREWKGRTQEGYIRCIFFTGTVFANPLGERCVFYLSWYGGEWHLNHRWLGGRFNTAELACVVKND